MFWALTSQVDVDARTLNSMRGRGVSHYVPSAKNMYIWRFPKIGVTPYDPFLDGIFLFTTRLQRFKG